MTSCRNQTSDSANISISDTSKRNDRDKDTSFSGIINAAAMSLRNRNSNLNNDRSFAEIMINYNRTAIAMTDLLQGHLKNMAIGNFANKSIVRRKDIIKEMEQFLRDEPEAKSPFSKDFQKSVEDAASKIRSVFGFQQTDINYLYIQSMIIFYQAEMIITEAELNYGSHQTLKIHARNILSAETEELQWLQSWLKMGK